MWKPFLLHGSLPLLQVPSLYFCLSYFFFLLPYPGMWGVSCLLGGLTSSVSIQWVFYMSSSTCSCISDVSMGRKVISTSYSSAIFSLLCFFLFLLPFILSCVDDRLLVFQAGFKAVRLKWESQVQDTGPKETSLLHVISNGENLQEICISTPRPSSTQRPAGYTAGHPMPNN